MLKKLLKSRKRQNRLLLKGIIITFIVLVIAILGLIILKLTMPKPIIIQNVDTIEIIVYDKPFAIKTIDKSVEVLGKAECKDATYANMNYATPVFKYLGLPINKWVVDYEYQAILYKMCQKYKINYIKALAIMYVEQAMNNPEAINKNSNGTIDIGLMQLNSINKWILKKLFHSEDLELLKDPKINIECACYYIKYLEKKQTNLFDSLVAYNGGIGTSLKIKSGEKPINCKAGIYAGRVISIMDALYEHYLNTEV